MSVSMPETGRIGVDIGGTFTDTVLEFGGTNYSTKVLTDQQRPEEAIVAGIEQVLALSGVAAKNVSMVIHGTTLVTNALIERRGARTAFITTEGFRDVVEMRRENRFEQYDLNLVLPVPLVPRKDRFTLHERLGADGRVLKAIDDEELDQLVGTIIEAGYESVAVGLMHAYVDGAHERRVRDAIVARTSGMHISLSSEVAPQIREFERFNTVCANAYVKPLVARYLPKVATRLAEIGIQSPIFMMLSGGGLVSLGDAAEYPVRLLESGPAGGAVYAACYAQSHGLGRVLSYDMGGTTAKICLIEDFEPKTTDNFEVARTYRFKKGSGIPVAIPVIEMVEIGAGGGSIAHVDQLRQIRVGPESAGSEPGPACYGRGGTRPTVTDANLLLGRLDADNFAGGSMTLSRSDAEAAVSVSVGQPLNLDGVSGAFGICEMVEENMANAARAHAVESGRDLADFTMIAFGGGAPIHAARLCEKLGIASFIVPPGAGVGSAIGFLSAPFGYEIVRSARMRVETLQPTALETLLNAMKSEATAFVERGKPGEPIVYRIRAFMRYTGQGWEIPVEINAASRAPDSDDLRALFEAAYRALFGRIIPGQPVEILSWVVRASTQLAPATPLPPLTERAVAQPVGSRHLFDTKARNFIAAGEFERSSMKPGHQVAGPAVIGEAETCTIVPSDFEAVMLGDRSLLVTRRKPSPERGQP
jgi:N-methylhydantoinase A